MKKSRFRFAVAARRTFRAAVDWVRSFSLRDRELYSDRGDNDAGATVTPGTIMQLDAVWGCVRLLAETIATLPLSVYERTPAGARIASEHPLHFIVHEQPNIDSTAAIFWEAFIASMLLRGAGRAEKLFVGPKFVGLAFLAPDRLVINRDPNTGRRRFVYFTDAGNQREIPAERIWTVPGFSLDGQNGCSVIAYGAKVFGGAIAAEKAAARTFVNGMLQTVFYKVSTWLTPSNRAEFKANVIGSVERGETPLLEGGVDVDTIGLKPEDAQLLQSRQYGVEMICRWFRVDPTLIGHGDKASNWGTGLEQKMIGFLTFTLAPMLRRIEQAIGKDLLTPADRRTFYAKFAVEGLLRADSAARATFYGIMVDHGIYTRDFCREREEQPPMGGNAAVLTVQSAMVPLDKLGEAANDPAAQVRNALVAWLRTAQNDDLQQLQTAIKETQSAIAAARI